MSVFLAILGGTTDGKINPLESSPANPEAMFLSASATRVLIKLVTAPLGAVRPVI